MSTFDEQFPSLNEKRDAREEVGVILGYSLNEIQECCLDKQRVRDAIKNAYHHVQKQRLNKNIPVHSSVELELRVMLEKELGL